MAKWLLVCTLLLIALATLVRCRSTANSANSEPQSVPAAAASEPKQLLFLGGTGKETSTPDFVRLVAMRLIYGLASTMGLEDRLEGVFNGVFVPPNADEGFFGIGGYDDDDGDDGGLDVLFDDI